MRIEKDNSLFLTNNGGQGFKNHKLNTYGSALSHPPFKLNFMKKQTKSILWKQLEIKEGKVYLRMKKRLMRMGEFA